MSPLWRGVQNLKNTFIGCTIFKVFIWEKRTIVFRAYYIKMGVKPNLEKIDAMMWWPLPTSVKVLRGFMGLTGYYRHFIKQYIAKVTTMSNLLKKDCFTWNDQAIESFSNLKKDMLEALVLNYPNFELEFTIQVDPCQSAIGSSSVDATRTSSSLLQL